MARETFGKTWWGKQWLQALEKIDYSNRIPRGLSYARNGKVSDIELGDGKISSTVKGSRYKPYKVVLQMDKFSKASMKTFLDEVMTYPTIVSRLLNGKMDPLLLDVARSQKMLLFPQKSADMIMWCSCPDHAVPCKHIAAVIYKVCSDIDNNPFVLFDFRGVDLKALLLNRNIDIYEIHNSNVPELSEFINGHIVKDEEEFKIEKKPLDFSILYNRREELCQLLEDNPAFFAFGDFKHKYLAHLTQIGKKADRVLSDKIMLKDLLEESDSPQIGREKKTLVWNGNEVSFSDGSSISTLWEIPNDHLDYHHSSMAYYITLIKLSLHCLSKGLVVPHLLHQEDHFTVLWLPSLLDPTLSALMDNLPFHYAVLLNDQNKGADKILSLGLIITHLIRKTAQLDHKSEYVEKLFFSNQKSVFVGLSESSIPAAITRWLRLFNFDLGNYYPVLEINELAKDSFGIHIKVGQKESIASTLNFEEFIEKTEDETHKFDFLKEIDLLSNFMEGVGEYINKMGASPILYDAFTFPKFLFKVQPIMSLLGIKMVMSKSLKALIRPKSSMKISKSSNESSGILGLAGLLNFDWKVSLGNELVSYSKFKSIVHQAGKLIKYKGQYVYISEQDLLTLEKRLLSPDKFSNMDILRVALNEEFEGTPISLSSEAKDLMVQLTQYDTLVAPKALQATLRPYQLRGYSWLVKNLQIGIGSIIADDMGLGKTVQVISLICYLKERKILEKKRALIVVPTSLIPNWESELNKFAPHINVHTYYGPNRSLQDVDDAEVILSTYGNIRSDITKLKSHKWTVAVIDESQNIKNPSAAQTKAIKALKADSHVAMSGTPVENRLMDYWSVMDFANKGLLGNKTSFKKEYDRPISNDRDQAVLEKFRKITSPFLLRRMKTDKSIITDLPDKITQDKFANLTVDQAGLYQKVVDEAMELIQNTDQEDPKSIFKRQGLVLQMILTLKQICNHPAQWLKNELIDPGLSGKSALLMDTLETLLSAGDKALIFTQFKGMGDILSAQINDQFGIDPLWLHGGTSLKKRKEMVNDFQNHEHKKLMILSIKAGGTGLNLTAANHVIHYDLWWNPAVEAQATDRAFRIGQKRNVFVHRLITKDTFEEKINELISSKKDLADMTVTSGEKWIGELSNKELSELFIH